MKFTYKHGFLLRDVAITLVIVMGVIALYVLMAGSIATDYNRNDLISPSFSQHYDKLNSLTSSIDQSRNAVSNSSSGTNLLGTFSVTFNSFFTVIQLVWDSLNIMGQMTASIISDYTFIPAAPIQILFTVLLAGLIIYITFSIISAVTRGRV